MNRETKLQLSSFWSDSLGCPEKAIESPRTGVFTREIKTDYNKNHEKKDVDVLIRNEEAIISCSEEKYDEVKPLEKEKDICFNQDFLQNAKIDAGEVLGPAFLSYADEDSFQPCDGERCRRLTAADLDVLERMKDSAEIAEIEDSIEEDLPSDKPMFGKFVGEELVAVSSYDIWDSTIAFISVFVDEDFRGEGYGKEVVSEAAKDAINENLIPSYRTLEKWSSSVGLAKSLGFERYATTYLIKLRN